MPELAAPPILKVSDLHAYYGESHALKGIELYVRPGELVTLLGRNGAGKTTTLKAIMGIVRPRSGVIEFSGRNVAGLLPEQIARLGLAYCPEERGIFASLTVEENLLLPPIVQNGGMPVDDIHTLFPNLLERAKAPGSKLSGGEQQMLAIGRILRTGSKLLLLDEPSEGLAPALVRQIGRVIRELKSKGFTILLVEQNFRFARTIADRHYIVDNGRVVDCIAAQDVDRAAEKLRSYLGV